MVRAIPDSKECPHCHEFFIPGGAYAAHTRSCANGGSTKRKRSRYRELFFAHNGLGPYICFFECEIPVTFAEVIVHHVDEDHTNNDLANLAPAHRSCHNRHHFKELWRVRRGELLSSPTRGHHTPHTEETKKKISEGHKAAGYAPSEEVRRMGNEARRMNKRKEGDVL